MTTRPAATSISRAAPAPRSRRRSTVTRRAAPKRQSRGRRNRFTVIPARAGIQGPVVLRSPWTPAFAGVTIKGQCDAEPEPILRRHGAGRRRRGRRAVRNARRGGGAFSRPTRAGAGRHGSGQPRGVRSGEGDGGKGP